MRITIQIKQNEMITFYFGQANNNIINERRKKRERRKKNKL